jgi:cytochrome c biogenesis protein CcmG/thiol:disulfide interchange protein DsbE
MAGIDAPDEDVATEDGGDLTPPRGRRTGLIVSAIVAVVAIAFVALLATRDPATDREAESPIVGRVAPALAGSTLDGETFDIDDQQGRWVVVNVFATWCVPCQDEHPELVRFQEAHADANDVRLVSVLYDDDPDDARAYFERNGGDWPVVLDEDGGIAVDWAVSGVPETYIVAPNGRVAVKLVGGVTQAGLDGFIADLEAGRTP